jgi:hypothetical protein
VDALLGACCKYLTDTLKNCTPPWAWLVFTVAQQLSKKELMAAAATQLACKALTEDSCIAHCSAALSALGVGSQELLKVLQFGVSKAVHGAAASEALLLVLLMRLDQLADDGTLPGGFGPAVAATAPVAGATAQKQPGEKVQQQQQ